MSHANAALTPRARLKLARLVVDEGWSIPQAARRFDVCYRTAQRWARRYVEMGQAGMQGPLQPPTSQSEPDHGAR